MKKILLVVLLIGATFSLAACGKKRTTSSYEVLSVAELKAAEEVNVTFRIPFGDAIQKVINEMIDSFNVEYPNVNITLDYFSGYDKMKEATIYEINGGITPTMIVGYPDHFAEYLITGSIISLDKFINAEDPVIGYSEAELADFLPGYIAENRQFDSNKAYRGLPFNKSTEVLYYNKDFFETYDLEVPETWDDLIALSAQIQTIVSTLEDNSHSWLPNIKTNLSKGQFLPMMYDSTGNLFTTIIHQFDGNYTSQVYRDNGVINLQQGILSFVEDKKAQDALTFLQTLANDKMLNVPDYWEELYGSGFFNDGRILMNIGSTAGISHYSTAKSSIGIAPIPYKDADHKYVIQQGTNVAIFANATDLEKLAAWLFIKHMLTPENTADFAMKTGYLPVRKSSYDLESYVEFLENPAPIDKSTSAIHNATLEYSKNGWNYFVDPAWSGSSTVRTEVGTALVQILVNKADVKQALKEARDRYAGTAS